MSILIRGIANSNEFNIKQILPPNEPWLGSTGKDEIGHAVFIDSIYSVRAAVRQLARYQLRDKLTCLNEIFSIYAPADDANNKPSEYAKFVGEKIGLKPDATIVLFSMDGSIIHFSLLIDMLKAMLSFECYAGFELPEETVRAGARLYERDFAGA